MWSDNETDLDLLGFQHLTNAVCTIIRNDALLPATIGVFGDWGSGKSSLLQMVRAELESDKDCLVLSFNGWLFEGYDDAKSALMGTIVDEIVAQRSTLATVTDKARGIAVRLLKKIQLFRVLTVGAKAVGAYSVGGWSAAAASLAIDGVAAGQELKAKYDDLVEGATDVTVEDLGSYLKSDRSQTVRRTVREFRNDFADLLKEMKIKRLVVLIDDLDRCMPDTIIETLEAIKLFLYVPHTAFVLGADERLVRYAVRRRFPELPGEKVEVGRDYLEKLVQFPVRVPPLGRAEMETYINLLFARKALTKPEEFEAARRCVVDCLPSSLLEVRYNHGIAEKALNRELPKDLSENLALAQKIAPILATGLVGNPRQCKRFLNTLVMRTEMAKGRGIELKQRVLAKLMLLEYFRPESFKALAEAQALHGGESKELSAAEEAIAKRNVVQGETAGTEKVKKQAKKDPLEVPPWLADTWIEEWLAIEPPLAGEDLRKYFYFSRDTLGPMTSAVQRMSPQAQSILTELAQESAAVRQNALKKAQSFGVGDAAAIFEALADKARVEDESDDEGSYLGQLCLWTIERPELSAQAITFLNTLPIDNLPIWVVTKVIAFSSVEKEHVRGLLVKWSQGNNVPLKGAATAKLKNF
ncbi:MAG: KAP family P-loop NTPase fold protein [Thermoguttaceae bacterium]